MFEGGKDLYGNWIDLSAGGFFTSGRKGQFQQRQRSRSGAFGGIEELCVQVSWRLASGEIAKNVLTPRSATGPSFKNLMIGSGKVWGKPESAVLKILPIPEVTHAILLRFALPNRREAFRASLQKLDIRFPLIANLQAADLSEWIGPENLGEAFLGLVHWGKAECLAPYLQMIRGLAESRQGVWQEFHDGDALPHLQEIVRDAAVAEWRETRIAEGFEDQQKLLKILSR